MTRLGGPRSMVDVWRRWREVSREDAPLRVAVLASYTADPLVPHLGLALHDGGMPASVIVGPYHQIAQQCADDDSVTARAEPDVVVVAPRFEECWRQSPLPDDPPDTDHAAELLMLADQAVSACARWHALLVFVLPALPEDRPFGVGDHGLLRGVTSTATAVREALRARLAGVPGVELLDLEAVVRSLGAANVHTPMLRRLAGIPYSEELFAALADEAERVLRLRFRPRRSCVAVDADSLLCGGTESEPAAKLLTPIVSMLRHNGFRAVVVSRSVFGEGWEDLFDDFELVGATWSPDAESAFLLTANPGGWPQDAGVIDIGADPGMWADNLAGHPVWDRTPPLGAPRPVSVVEVVRGGTSLADYIKGLELSVRWRQADADLLPHVAEMAEKTKDFTLGQAHDEDSLAAFVEEESATLLAGEVRDRLADHGYAVVFGARFAGGTCVVDPFYLSCPAMGRGVEDEAVARIVELAAERQCGTVVFRCAPTGRNDAALRFLKGLPDAVGAVRVVVEELPVLAGAGAAP